MTSYKFLVYTNAAAGRDDEFNKWYESQHLGDVLSVDAIKSAKRFRRSTHPGQPPTQDPAAAYQYLTIYDVEADDPTEVLAAIGERTKGRISDALDAAPPSVMWFTEAGELRTS